MNYPTENGRIVNPYNPSERPTFLPGDKVRDKRDVSGRVWRITRREAHYDTEQIDLRDVNDPTNVRTVLANQLIPHLEMVAMSI